MRIVPHPDHIYIQIDDDRPTTLSFSFNDDLSRDTGIDPNHFDKETLLRVTKILANVFVLINDRLIHDKPIKYLNDDETESRETQV